MLSALPGGPDAVVVLFVVTDAFVVAAGGVVVAVIVLAVTFVAKVGSVSVSVSRATEQTPTILIAFHSFTGHHVQH